MRRSIALFLTFMLLFLASCKTNPEAKLHRAAYMGRVDEMRKLIDEGMEVNEVDTTAFIDASKPIYDEFSQSVDGAAELIKKAQDLAAQ